jgi:AcrR family transcriptional regulator
MSNDYAGSGDFKRSLELLWGSKERPARGPRPKLTVAQIVRAAIEIADADGLRALSMRRVAESLGTGTMSLYRYVPSKSELIDVMIDAVWDEGAWPDEQTGDWRARLEQAAREEHALYQRHPWLLHVSQARPLFGPNSMAAYDAALRTVAGLGLSGHEMAAMTALVSFYVQGTARTLTEFRQAPQRTGVTDEQWWGAQLPFMEKAFADGRFPTLAAVHASGAYEPDDDFFSFEFGLQRVLDGVETFIQARSAQLPGTQ